MKKDLRDLDEKEFREIYTYLKDKTNGFKEVSTELILKNPCYILIFRLCLKLSQKNFSKKIEKGKDTCRHIEAGRRKIIQNETAERYSNQIETLLKNYKITYEKTLEAWKNYMFYRDQKLTKSKTNFGSISKISEENLKELYKITKERTKNFTKFNYKLLLELPQSLLIFRTILKEDHRIFARKLGICPKGCRTYEAAKARIKPRTAKMITKKLPNIFTDENTRNIDFNKLLENKRILTNFFGHRNHEAMMKQGLTILAKLPQTGFENDIAELLDKHSIEYEKCAIINGMKKSYNIDFIIPNSKNPKIIIEAFTYTIGGRSRNTKSKICNIDHRYQSIKMRHPQIKTIIVIKFTGRPILLDRTKMILDLEVLNTDKIFINQELKKLPNFLRKDVLGL